MCLFRNFISPPDVKFQMQGFLFSHLETSLQTKMHDKAHVRSILLFLHHGVVLGQSSSQFMKLLIQEIGFSILVTRVKCQDDSVKSVTSKILKEMFLFNEKQRTDSSGQDSALVIHLKRLIKAEISFNGIELMEFLKQVSLLDGVVLKSIMTSLEHEIIALENKRGRMGSANLRNSLMQLKKMI